MYIKKDSNNTKSFFIIGSVSIFLALIFLFLGWMYFSHKNSSLITQHNFYPAQSFSNTKSSSSFNPDSCIFIKAENPLITNLDHYQGDTIGVFTGTISSLMMQPQDALIEVMSLDKKQDYAFTIHKTVAVYNKIDETPLDFSSLHVGRTVVMQFTCKTSENNTFVITSIGILQ